MKTLTITVLSLFLLSLSGCGYVHFGQPKELQPVKVGKIVQMIAVNQAVVGYLTTVIQDHSEDYTKEELKLMTKAVGSLDSLMAYSQLIASTGKANVCKVETIWEQAQIDYYVIIKTVKTDTWEEGDKHLYNMVINEAKQLASIVDESLKEAGDNATREDMDLILGQIKAWAGTAMTLM